MTSSLCVVGSLFGPAEGGQECGPCYQMDMRSVVGIITCDIILTVLITVCVFCFATFQRRRRRDSRAGRGKPPSTLSKRKTAEDTESPYQELQGVHSDVYSDLRQFRK